MQTERYNDVRTGCLVFADRCLTCKRSESDSYLAATLAGSFS